jgi:phytoene desaturase
MSKKVHVIGSGFSSLSAACYLAQKGFQVTVFEKNDTLGGRASQFVKDGFTFDMGPSWYWMPGVFERFFADFGKQPSDYYELEKLSPAYSVYFGKKDFFTVGDCLDQIYKAFEAEESGSAKKLEKFISNAKKNYQIAIDDLVYNPGVSPLELVSPKTIANVHQFFSTISKDVRKSFVNPRLVSILEFPVLFLGAKPSDTPSFYSFMNYADFGLGTWHPKGGMFKVVEGIVTLAKSLGVVFNTSAEISEIVLENGKVSGLKSNGSFIPAEVVLSGADYHHTETLLPKKYRQYSESYWAKKTFAPSSLLFYVGFDKKIKNVNHHTLFFDVDFDAHAKSIYDNPEWPNDPLFYANFPSISDASFAPQNKEAGFFLVPIAPGLEDTPELRAKYFDLMLARFELVTDQKVKDAILFKESFCVNDFESRYHSYKGNAYGMANTLLQTAFLRPKLKSKKVAGLYFSGQLTVPGPGVPPALISGKLVAELI